MDYDFVLLSEKLFKKALHTWRNIDVSGKRCASGLSTLEYVNLHDTGHYRMRHIE